MFKKIKAGTLKEIPKGLKASKQVILNKDGSIILFNPHNRMCISETRVYKVDIDKMFKNAQIV